MESAGASQAQRPNWKRALPMLCLTQVLVLSLALIWNYCRELRVIEQFCQPRGGYTALAAAALAGVIISTLSNTYIDYRIKRHSASALWVRDELLGPIFSEMPFIWSSALSLLAAVCEEFMFRGVIASEWGLLVSGLLFGLMHGGHRHLRTYMIWAGMLGLLMGELTMWSHSLWPAIALHCANNMTSCRYLRRVTKHK